MYMHFMERITILNLKPEASQRNANLFTILP